MANSEWTTARHSLNYRYSPFAIAGDSMRLCRFGDNRLGLVQGDQVRDVTAALEALPTHRYPLPCHDSLVAHLDDLPPTIAAPAQRARPIPLGSVELLSPIANPGKIVAAPVNYKKHL